MTEKIYMTADELINSDIKDPDWIVEKIIAECGVTMFVGQPKSSKSMLVLNLALSVATGQPFLEEFKVKQGRVLYIDEENGCVEMKDRLSREMKGMEIDSCDIDFMIYKDVKLDNDTNGSWKKTLTDYIDERKPVLVICDSMVRFMVGDENSAKDVRKVFDFVKHLKEKTSWALLHHTPKGRDDARGSGDWFGQVDDAFVLSRRKGKHQFNLKSAITRRANWVSIDYQILGEEGKPLSIVNQGEAVAIARRRESEKLAEEVMKWLKRTDRKDFKRQDADKEFNVVRKKAHADEVPYSRMTGTLNYLVKEKSALQTDGAGHYTVQADLG